MAMGGRVAEELVFNHRSTGASNDLQVSTERARRMVTEFGMSDKIGPRAWGTSGPVFLGEDFGQQREYSEDTSRLIDDEVEQILRVGETRCKELVQRNRGALDLIAQALLDQETISGDEVNRLIAMAQGGATDIGRATAPQPPVTPPPLPQHLTPDTASAPEPGRAPRPAPRPTGSPIPRPFGSS